MIIDLDQSITKSRQENDQICIMGDLNEVLGNDPDLMAKVCCNHGLYDVLLEMHPSEIGTPTYNRGHKRLDYLLLSNKAPQLIHMGHNPCNFLYHSDHQASFLKLPLKETFSMAQSIVPVELRAIHSDSNYVNIFIKTISIPKTY